MSIVQGTRDQTKPGSSLSLSRHGGRVGEDPGNEVEELYCFW